MAPDEIPQTQPTTPAAATPPPAVTPPKAPEKAPAGDGYKPPTEDEWRATKAESIKAAREARDLKTRLAALEAEGKEVARGRETSAAEQKRLAELKERNPQAWLAALAGETPEQLAARLKGQPQTPENQLRRELAEIKEALTAREKAEAARAEAESQARVEAAQTNAYRSVLSAAKGSPELAAVADILKESPKKSAAWIANWAETQWDTYAAEHGLDASSPEEAAKACAQIIRDKEVARLKKLVQDPHIAKALGLGGQSQQPPASKGDSPRSSIDADMASRRSEGSTDAGTKPLTDAELRRRALLKWEEREAARKQG
jgi:hypothetical protein